MEQKRHDFLKCTFNLVGLWSEKFTPSYLASNQSSKSNNQGKSSLTVILKVNVMLIILIQEDFMEIEKDVK